MNELLTALHLEVVILDLRIKMLEAIESGYFDLAMTMHLLLLVRIDELDAHSLRCLRGSGEFMRLFIHE